MTPPTNADAFAIFRPDEGDLDHFVDADGILSESGIIAVWDEPIRYLISQEGKGWGCDVYDKDDMLDNDPIYTTVPHRSPEAALAEARAWITEVQDLAIIRVRLRLPEYLHERRILDREAEALFFQYR